MFRPRDALICALLVWGYVSRAAPPSAAGSSRGDAGAAASSAASPRKLTGRFLHITDFHPDPFYKTYSSTSEAAACHRKRGPAGVYGAETSGCDSPFSLINQTFQWISDNIKDDIDFVIWTGDSARHDNDEDIPRTQKQIIQQNEFLVNKFAEVFGQSAGHRAPVNDYVIPIVPTFGNNDIMPHNIFLGGPNKWTMKYLDIWRSFIPEAQRHQFQQGGWFSVEVIPGKLAVISLNTIYFFTSNSGVDGCASKHEPGYQHMEWLRIQLSIMRDRGIKAILMGHVPPARVDSKESWDETCWQKYTLWTQQYRDVIVGSVYGHMNIDHFMLQDFEEIQDDTKKGDMARNNRVRSTDDGISLLEDGEVTVASASDYLLGLRETWAQLPSLLKKSNRKSQSESISEDEDEDEDDMSTWEWLISTVSGLGKKGKSGKSDKKKYLKKIGGKYAERYSVSHVSPSVVPNYFPTLRIVEYNITGLEDVLVQGIHSSPKPLTSSSYEQLPFSSDPLSFSDDEEYEEEIEALIKKNQKERSKVKKSKKYRFKVPEGPSKSAPPGPAYSPQVLTWTRYIQYFANLTQINNDFVNPQRRQRIPTTAGSHSVGQMSINDMSPRTVFGLAVSATGEIEHKGWKEGKHKKHQGKQPKPEPHPNEFVFEVEYDTKDKKFPDLTVRRWVEYARKIGQRRSKKHSLEAREDDYVDEDEDAMYEDRETLEEEEEEEEEEDGEYDINGKKHKKKKHKRKASKEWYTFVKRAFVGTMDSDEIHSIFGGASPAAVDAQPQEAIEL